MIWANLAMGLGIAVVCLLISLMAGTLINQWKLKRKDFSGGAKDLDSLIRHYIKQFSPRKSTQWHQGQYQQNERSPSTSQEYNSKADHKGIQQFYDQVFHIFEQSEIEKEKCELNKILDFLKDFSHPQSGPHWRRWANGFQTRWGFAPAKLAVLEGLEHTKKLPTSADTEIAKTFFEYLERIVFIQMWSWEQLDNYLPAKATASLSASMGISRQYQHLFSCCWFLETAGMPQASFMGQQKTAMGLLKKMTKEKRVLLIIKMANINSQISFTDLLKKKYSIWIEQFRPGTDQDKNSNKNQQTQGLSDDEYKILGVSPHDNIHHIKKMYRKLALTYHPDQFANEKLSEFDRKSIERRFVKIKMAYEKIVNQKMKTG